MIPQQHDMLQAIALILSAQLHLDQAVPARVEHGSRAPHHPAGLHDHHLVPSAQLLLVDSPGLERLVEFLLREHTVAVHVCNMEKVAVQRVQPPHRVASERRLDSDRGALLSFEPS